MLRQPLDVSVRSLVPGRRSGAEAQVGGPVSEELLSSTAAGFRHDVERCRTLNPGRSVMVPCPGRVLRYQGERLRAAGHVASSSAAVKDVSRLRLPVRRTRYFRWACRGLSETLRGSSLDEWAAAERVVVQFLALPVLPGAASTASGPPRRAPSWRICCSSDRHTGTPCCTRSGLVAHVDFGLAFDLRRREVLFRAGFELSESLGG